MFEYQYVKCQKKLCSFLYLALGFLINWISYEKFHHNRIIQLLVAEFLQFTNQFFVQFLIVEFLEMLQKA